MKPCPACSEQLRDETSICPYCWSIVSATDRTRAKRPGVTAFALVAVLLASVLYAAC